MLRVYLSKSQFESGSTKPEVVRSAPGTGLGERFYKKVAEAKQGNCWIDYSLSICLIWKKHIGCL